MPLSLSLITQPSVPVEAERLSPAHLHGLDADTVAKRPLLHGNIAATLGDFFKISGRGDGEIRLSGDLSRIKHIGAGMKSGRLVIDGDVGQHLGAGMSGGEILVEGDAGDWVGPEILGGRIIIRGNAGHLAGSAYRGSAMGMLGGEIIIHGDAKNEIGHGMRRGLIVIGGDAGDFTGVNMLSGTIIVLGKPGIRTGAGMKRGTIACMHDAEILPTFSYACKYRPIFIRLYLNYLRTIGFELDDGAVSGPYHRWCGDSVAINRGEILLFAG